jgi:hypothetical protein
MTLQNGLTLFNIVEIFLDPDFVFSAGYHTLSYMMEPRGGKGKVCTCVVVLKAKAAIQSLLRGKFALTKEAPLFYPILFFILVLYSPRCN